MIARIYNVVEVERMLPLVEAIVAELRERSASYRAVGSALAVRNGETPMAPDSLPPALLSIRDDIRRCARELEMLGACLRDPEQGLVEWYGEVDGEIAYLSWLPGEDAIRHWRGLYSRPAHRRPLVAAGAAPLA